MAYNLWNPPPYDERRKELDRLFSGFGRRKKVDPKRLAAAIKANEKLIECFKPRPISLETLLRPICDHR